MMKWWYRFIPVIIGLAMMIGGMIMAGPEPELSPRLWMGMALSWGGAGIAIFGSLMLR